MTHTKDMIVKVLKEDKEVAQHYYRETVAGLFRGETRTNLIALRNLVNATIGFPKMSEKIGVHEKSLHRMLSANGTTPKADVLFSILNFFSEYFSVKQIRISDKNEAA